MHDSLITDAQRNKTMREKIVKLLFTPIPGTKSIE